VKGCEAGPRRIDDGEAGDMTWPPAQNGPYAVEVVEGRQYLWCACGLSANQPWCDGSHGSGEAPPVAFIAPVSGIFYMCGCKRSQNKPYCFGNCRGLERAR